MSYHNWTTIDIPDLNGKVIIVTGANTDLGFGDTYAGRDPRTRPALISPLADSWAVRIIYCDCIHKCSGSMS